MKIASIVTHYLEQIVRKSCLSGFEEMRAEILSDAETDDAIITELKRQIYALDRRITFLEQINPEAR